MGFGSLWIFGSGWLLHHLVPDGPLAAGLELAKGWCFVAITAFLLGLVLNRYFREIHRAARQFQEHENRLRLISDNLPDGYVYQYTVDADGQPRFTYISAGVERVLGVTPADVLRDAGCLMALLEPDQLPAYAAAEAESARTLADFAMDQRMRRPDGNVRLIHVHSRPGRTAEGRVEWDGFVTDITERKQAEAALAASRAKLEAALASMTDAVFISDTEGRFIEFNDAFATFHKFKTKAECAKTFAEYPDILDVFLASGDPAPVEQWAVPRALRGETGTNVEYSLRRKDTGETWVGSYSFAPVRDPSGAIVGSVVVGRDITAQKLATESLRQSEARLKFALEASQVGAWSLDPRDGTATRTPIHARIFGQEGARTDWGLDQFLEHVLPEDRGEAHRIIQEAIAAHANWNMECRIRRADGEVRWVFVAGGHERNALDQPVRVAGIIQDITARKRAEAAALREQRLLRTLIDLLPDNIYVKDTASRFLVTNAANAKALGKGSPAKVVGLSDADFFPVPIAAAFRAQEEKVMAGEALIEFEEENVFPDGRRCVGLSTKVPWRDAEGRICGLVGIGRDITARKEAEEKIRELNRNLEQRVQERTAELRAANEELDAFVYAVSHDLRAPLRAMSGFSQALREDFGNQLPVAARDFLEHIQAGSREMGSLIDGLLRLSRSTRGDLMRETVDLSILALRILDGFHQAEPQRVVTWAVEPGLVVNGDARWLEVVLVNLLGNAWKYTAHRSQPTIRVYSQPGASTTTICVTDNGAGFDPKHAAKLFQPFQRLHREDEFPGLGLGLATVLRIIRRHGGSLQATSTPGAGATFSFSLPQQRL
jgi:PAS domain S-box-containing protein